MNNHLSALLKAFLQEYVTRDYITWLRFIFCLLTVYCFDIVR